MVGEVVACKIELIFRSEKGTKHVRIRNENIVDSFVCYHYTKLSDISSYCKYSVVLEVRQSKIVLVIDADGPRAFMLDEYEGFVFIQEHLGPSNFGPGSQHAEILDQIARVHFVCNVTRSSTIDGCSLFELENLEYFITHCTW